jgi:NAD-dependent deacetylase
MKDLDVNIRNAAGILKKSKYTSVFTGAGISVESGIPPFRGENGIWSKYDPMLLDIHYFQSHPEQSWKIIKEIFYDFFGMAKPNAAHMALAEMEKERLLHAVITQNIDNLHQDAGSKVVYEFHGSSKYLVTMDGMIRYHVDEIDLSVMPPKCQKTGVLLKPDFIFFGEGIPQDVYQNSLIAAGKSEVMLVIGTTGEIMPASQIPLIAKQNGAKIIEINPDPSNFTHSISDIFIQGKATEIMSSLRKQLFE